MSIDLNSDPEVFCVTCGRTMQVREVAGYPPNVFKNKLARICKVSEDCGKPVPMYRPGVQIGGPAVGQG